MRWKWRLLIWAAAAVPVFLIWHWVPGGLEASDALPYFMGGCAMMYVYETENKEGK